MMDNLTKKLKEIEKDCLQLKKEKQLTEYGQGQLDIIRIIKSLLNEQKKEIKKKLAETL